MDQPEPRSNSKDGSCSREMGYAAKRWTGSDPRGMELRLEKYRATAAEGPALAE